MAVQIRLARHGSKKSPFYRIIVTDKRSPRDGRFIEMIGTYNPNVEPAALELRADRFEYWVGQGAQASSTLGQIVKRQSKAQQSAS